MCGHLGSAMTIPMGFYDIQSRTLLILDPSGWVRGLDQKGPNGPNGPFCVVVWSVERFVLFVIFWQVKCFLRFSFCVLPHIVVWFLSGCRPR